MNLWLRNVKEVEVVAPLVQVNEPQLEKSYDHNQIIFTQIPAFNLLSLKEGFLAMLKIPVILITIFGAMKRADHLHLRCPGNIGLIACFLQTLFPNKPKTAKYAGNWDPKTAQPWTYKLQKWILSNSFLTRNMQVLVYGEWPKQSKNIKSFFTASFSEKEISVLKEKSFTGNILFIFVGNLVPGKQPLNAIQLIQKLKYLFPIQKASVISLEIYGNGPERKKLENYCRSEKLEALVKFRGSRPLEELKLAYHEADFVLLPSLSEGWPKAVAEGMFFGCVPIATAVSCVPWMLDYGNRGILIPDLEKREENREKRGEKGVARGQRSEDKGGVESRRVESGKFKVDSQDVLEGTVERIINLIEDPEEMRRMSLAAQEWSQQYTLERFEEEIKKLLETTKREQKRK